MYLTDFGRRQAAALASALAPEPFSVIYASPLTRTMETAGAIATEHHLDVQVEAGLVEMDIGEAEGLTFAQVRERFPSLAQNWGGPDGPTFRMPGGERLVDVQERAWDTVQRLLARHQSDTVCAVTHNFVILSILAIALKMELAHFRRLRHAVAAISILDIEPGRIRVVRLNDTCHLEAQRR